MATRADIVKKLQSLIVKLDSLFMKTYADSLRMLEKQIESGSDFSWDKNKGIEKKIDKLIGELANKANVLIENGVTHYQQYGVDKAVQNINTEINKKKKENKITNKDASKEIKALDKQATATQRANAVGGHLGSINVRGGSMGLSNRVWLLNDQVKKELEIVVQDAIKKGYSVDMAIKLAQQYLKNPKQIDVWKQDKDGNWYITDAAKNYHPGQGVYRSAKKNVERMLRTEMNAAYNTAEITQYQKNPMVKGIHIALSGNHTTKLPKGGVKKIKDICDELQGDYPKSFIFTGWHPNCRCVITPILLTDAEFEEYIQAKHDGKLEEFEKKHNIQDMPPQMVEWVENNEKRIEQAQNDKNKQLPEWTEQAVDNVEELQKEEEQQQKVKIDFDFIDMDEYSDAKDIMDKADSDEIRYVKETNEIFENVKKINIKNIDEQLKDEVIDVINEINKADKFDVVMREVRYLDNINKYNNNINKVDINKISLKMPYEIYKKHSDVTKNPNLKVLFDGLKSYVPLQLQKSKKGAEFFKYSTNFVQFNINNPRYNSDKKLERVIFHEYGHATDYINGIRKNPEKYKAVNDFYQKLKSDFSKKRTKIKNEIEDYISDNITKLNGSLLSEEVDIMADILNSMGINVQYAIRPRGYWLREDYDLIELIAHICTIKNMGNSFIKDKFPQLYNDILKLGDKIF